MIKRLAESSLFNVLMFSAFWAFQIFFAKLGFIAGAMAIPLQLVMVVTAMVTLAVLILPRSGPDLGRLSRQHPDIFWNLFLANGLQAGLGTFLSIIGIALTDAINAGFLVKLATVTTILFAIGELKPDVIVLLWEGTWDEFQPYEDYHVPGGPGNNTWFFLRKDSPYILWDKVVIKG